MVEALQAGLVARIVIRRYSDRRSPQALRLSDTDVLRMSLENAVRGGRDADTVAAIAGGLVGAALGASAVPEEWLSVIHGWPGYKASDLSRRASQILACR